MKGLVKYEMEKCGRKLSQHSLMYCPAFVYRERGKPLKTSVKIAGFRDEI
jgi:hypothetical protein